MDDECLDDLNLVLDNNEVQNIFGWETEAETGQSSWYDRTTCGVGWQLVKPDVSPASPPVQAHSPPSSTANAPETTLGCGLREIHLPCWFKDYVSHNV